MARTVEARPASTIDLYSWRYRAIVEESLFYRRVAGMNENRLNDRVFRVPQYYLR